MQGSRVIAWVCLAGMNTLLFLSGCSEDTPTPTPTPERPKDPNACTEIGRCNIDGPKDDGNPCTSDGCDPCNNTVHEVLPNNVACAGGSECMATGFCLNGTCTQEAVPDGTQCGFFDACSQAGTCMAGTCVTQPGVTCKGDEFCSLGKCIKLCSMSGWFGNSGQGSGTTALATGDVNGDMVPDFLLTSYATDTADVMLSNGSGIVDVRGVAAGPDPAAVAVAELNGDGNVDIVVANLNWNSITVLLNNGQGSWAAGGLYPLGQQPRSINTADLNGDGLTDLIVGGENDVTHVFLHDSNGLFSQKTSQDGGWATIIADLDGDSDLDLAVTSPVTQSISTLMNKGDGTFNARTQYPIGTESFRMAAADLDGDGDTDLAAISEFPPLVHFLWNKGNGTFDGNSSFPIENSPVGIATADVNLDGLPDLLVIHSSNNIMAVHPNLGGGAFMPPRWYNIMFNSLAVTSTDVDLDGKPDAVVGSDGGVVGVILNACLQEP